MRLRVEVVDCERVVARGYARTVWFVRAGDTWLAVRAAPGATVESLDARPGTVWESRLELDVPAGARFMRVTTRPAARRREPALTHLRREARRAKKLVTRTEFTVDARGKLVPDRAAGASDAPDERAKARRAGSENGSKAERG